MSHTLTPSLSDNALGSEKGSFLKEIEMMKKVTDTQNEYSKFVVNMVGCVTVKEPLLLVLEYVQHGDLLKYLRAMKKQVSLDLMRGYVTNGLTKDVLPIHTL